MKIRWLYLLLASAFGPYIFMSIGVRLEHIVLYSLLLFFTVTNSLHVKNNLFFGLPLFFLLLLILIPFFGLPFYYENVISNGLIFSQIENYLQPFTIVIISFSILHKLSYEKIENSFLVFLKVFIVLMSIHTLLSFCIFLFPKLPFWRNFTGQAEIDVSYDLTREGFTASELARIGGRITGVFTQVFEAGYAYSLVLLSWAYLHSKYGNFLIFQNLFLVLIIIGGLLVSSKIFLVFGLGLFFIFFNMKLRIFLLGVLGYFSIVIVTLIFNIETSTFLYKPLKFINRLLNVNSDNIFSVLTGNRFSSGSNVYLSTKEVLQTSPIIGKGYGSIAVSDFSLLEVLNLGGVLGVIVYLCLFLFFIFLLFFIKNWLDWRFYFSIIVLTLFSSLAAPTLTANRVSIFFWIIWSFMVTLVVFKSKLRNTI